MAIFVITVAIHSTMNEILHSFQKITIAIVKLIACVNGSVIRTTRKEGSCNFLYKSKLIRRCRALRGIVRCREASFCADSVDHADHPLVPPTSLCVCLLERSSLRICLNENIPLDNRTKIKNKTFI